jgi:UDP-GlcNAc:undecaprenyl-phosphate GlcNAc-1-phosphate transferase
MAAIAFLLSLAVTFLVTPLVIRLSWGLFALDVPGVRKVHKAAVPRLGGVAVVMGLVAGIGCALWFSGYSPSLFGAVRYHWIGWIGAIGILFLCGLVDDLITLGAGAKLGLQTLAALIIFVAGFQIDRIVVPGLGPLGLIYPVALVVTVLWIVGVTNAINLIDGLDGLATGTGFLITATVAAISYSFNNTPVTLIALALAGSLLGFLPYNMSPARIFLGDSGSHLIGVTLAVISIRGVQKSATAVAVLAPLLILGLPILDTVLVVLRRTWRIHRAPSGVWGLRARLAMSQGLFQADREHIHHNLLELGLSPRSAVLVLYGASAVFCVAAFTFAAFHNPWLAVVLAVTTTLATIIVKLAAVRRRAYAPPRVLATLPTGDPAAQPRPVAPAPSHRSGEC